MAAVPGLQPPGYDRQMGCWTGAFGDTPLGLLPGHGVGRAHDTTRTTAPLDNHQSIGRK